MAEEEIPIYELTIDENSGSFIEAVALVDSPAIESNFFAFKKEKVYEIFSEERREVIGAAMIPNFPMLRVDPATGEKFKAYWSEETVRSAAQSFMKMGLQDKLNVMHIGDMKVEGFIFQSFIVDSNAGISAPKALGALPDGTWVIGAKINDNVAWEAIKNGTWRGFSVEGWFLKNSEPEDDDFSEAETRIISDFLNSIYK